MLSSVDEMKVMWKDRPALERGVGWDGKERECGDGARKQFAMSVKHHIIKGRID